MRNSNLFLILALLFTNLSFASFNDLTEAEKQVFLEKFFADDSTLTKEEKEEKEVFFKYYYKGLHEQKLLFNPFIEGSAFEDNLFKDGSVYKNLVRFKDDSIFLRCKEKVIFKFNKEEIYVGFTQDRKNALIISKSVFSNGIYIMDFVVQARPPYYKFYPYKLNTNNNELEGVSGVFSCEILPLDEWDKEADKFLSETAKKWQKDQAEAKEESRLKY